MNAPPASRTAPDAALANKATDSAHAAPAPAKSPLLELMRVAAPSIATMTSYTIMQFMDSLMVSHIRPADSVYLTAQGNGGMGAWLAISVVMGLLSIINTYVSQNLGAGKAEEGGKYAWAGLYMSALSGLLLLPYALALPLIYAKSGHGPRLLELESQYAQILLVGAVFTIGARTLSHYFYGMHRSLVVFVAAISGNVVNVVLNVLLIYGVEGMPTTGIALIDAPASWIAGIAGAIGLAPMGVAGAAVATVAGGLVEFAIETIVFLGPRYNRLFRTRAAWRTGLKPFVDVLRLGWPGALMFANEMCCWAYLMSVMLGKAGAAAGDNPVLHNNAGWVALRYMHASFMPAVGMSFAVTAVVGKYMGMGRPDLAARRAWLGLTLTMSYMAACALVFLLARGPLVSAFIPAGLDAEEAKRLLEIGGWVMIGAAIFQVFDAMAITFSAALRGAGDTVWPGVLTIALSWSVIMIGGHAMIRFFPHLGSIGPWIAASAYIILLGVILMFRFMGGGWKKRKLVEKEEGLSPE